MTTGVAPVVRGSHRGQRWKLAALALIVILIAVLMSVPGVRSRLFNPAKPAPAISPNKARRSIAVLGFKNLSGNPEHAWISTALAELLSTELGAGEQIRTIPGENVARTKHDLELEDADSFGRDSLGKIRAHLGTDLIVVGSYLDMGSAAGAKLRLDLRLQDAVAGETIASISETGTENDLLELISQSGAKLRQKIGVGQVTASDASDVRASVPGNTEAARLYSDGLAKLRVLDALAARDLLERAVKADPKHAPSHVALAEAWSALGYDARAAGEGLQASRLSQSASREERLFVEARSNELAHRSLAEARVDVFFDKESLQAGENWETKLREKIRRCSLFMPIISHHVLTTELRFFRREWQHALGLFKESPAYFSTADVFMLPVVIDGTQPDNDRIPEDFRKPQWWPLPEGLATPEFVRRVKELHRRSQQEKAAGR